MDPIGQVPDALGDAQSYNRYGYARNNPLRFVDPDGLTPFDLDTLGPTFFPWLYVPVATFRTTSALGEDTGMRSWESGGPEFEGVPDRSMVPLAEGISAMAGPGVNLAVDGLRAFGWAVAAPLMAVAECIAGNCDKTAIGLAILPPIGGILNGAKLLRAARGFAAAAIYEKAGGFARATAEFGALAGAERTIGAVTVKELSDGSRAVLRTFSTDGRVTLEIQHANGQVTKIRYN